MPLYAFAVEPDHDQSTLERYLEAYPLFAGELIDLYAEIQIERRIGLSYGVHDRLWNVLATRLQDQLRAKYQAPRG